MTKILIVEDEASFSDAIKFLLEKEGFEVAVTNNGQSGLDYFAKNGAELILLDLMLPGLSGTEVCRQIRLKSSVPIIMLTARDAEIDKVVGLELGADDYVTKPYSSRELIARINAVLRRVNSPDGADEMGVISIGGIRLDIDRHLLSVNNQPVSVPLKIIGLFSTKLFCAGVIVAVIPFTEIEVSESALAPSLTMVPIKTAEPSG
jgi:two-component system response regulator RegX3